MANIQVPPMIPLDKLRKMRKEKQGAQVVSGAARMEKKVVPYKILGEKGIYAGAEFAIDREVIFGRNPKEASIIFRQDMLDISHKHYSISIDKSGAVLLKDLGSSMGTYLEDGTRLRENIAYRLERGERFYLANKQEVYRLI